MPACTMRAPMSPCTAIQCHARHGAGSAPRKLALQHRPLRRWRSAVAMPAQVDARCEWWVGGRGRHEKAWPPARWACRHKNSRTAGPSKRSRHQPAKKPRHHIEKPRRCYVATPSQKATGPSTSTWLSACNEPPGKRGGRVFQKKMALFGLRDCPARDPGFLERTIKM